MRLTILATIMLACLASTAHAQGAIPVTVDNFTRAETDLYFGTAVRQAGGTGRFFHYREPMAIDKQTVVRPNRDTLYSAAVVDLDAGPATVSLPDAGDRFRSMLVINEDHYVVGNVEYRAGDYTYDRDKVGTRYAIIALRTLVDPSDPKDIQQVHDLQDAAKVSQAAGKFEVPNWDPASQKRIRDALLVLASSTGGFKNAFGPKSEVDPVKHLIGTAAGWGGNPAKDATYLTFEPAKNDGNTVYRLTVPGNVPVDGFWSISLYDAGGYFEKNDLDAYSVNNITAKKGPDGAVDVQFGGCDGKVPNCLPIMKGWNYTVRLYRPRGEILDGTWKLPEPQAVN